MKNLIITLTFGLFSFSSFSQGTGCQAFYQYTLGLCPEIMFFDGSQVDPADQIGGYLWSFGDGSTSTDQNPVHVYTANGLYPVCLTIQTVMGCVSEYCDTIDISCIQQPQCQAMFQVTMGNGCSDLMFFDGSSVDSGDAVNSWSWTFGDGSTSSDQNPNHTYTSDGGYEVCLSIATDQGCSSTYCDSVFIDCQLSVEESDLSLDFDIAPNPANDVITISRSVNEKVDYKIMSLTGSVEQEGQLQLKNEKINISNLSKGVYIVLINTQNEVRTKRIIKN